MNFHQSLELYREKFGDQAVPMIIGLSPEDEEKAADLFDAAVASGKPVPTGDAWYEALGREPPPADADV
jgi:hypothetical protein